MIVAWKQIKERLKVFSEFQVKIYVSKRPARELTEKVLFLMNPFL